MKIGQKVSFYQPRDMTAKMAVNGIRTHAHTNHRHTLNQVVAILERRTAVTLCMLVHWCSLDEWCDTLSASRKPYASSIFFQIFTQN